MIFIGIIAAFLVLRLTLPEQQLKSFVTSINIALVIATALMCFTILNVIVKQKEDIAFDVYQLKVAWNMITLTVMFLSLSYVFSYVIDIKRFIFIQNLNMIFFVIFIGGLYYFYKSIKAKKRKIKKTGK